MLHHDLPAPAPVRTRVARCLSLAAALLCVALTGLSTPQAQAQDTRTVTEPVFPATCTALAASQAVVTTGTPPQSEVNFSGEPTSETTFDTSRIQTALTACPAGQAVELTTDSTGANNAFLIQPLNIPKGVTLLVDAGVTVFGSRNPADYQVATAGVETCGTVGTKGNGCNPLLTINNNSSSTGSGIMGFGVINGRGGDQLIVNGTVTANSWWDLANQANTGSNAQNNPILLYVKNAASFTLYKISLINSAMFHVKYQTASGFTVWGVKIVTPYSARNSDGIDPDDRISNVTIANSYISDGDDDIAIGASGTGNAVTNVSITNLATHAGHGISIGSFTSGGVSNVQVMNVTQAGDTVDGNSAGIKIKSAKDKGGLVSNITYQNICMQNQRSPMQFNPFYDTTAGTSYPSYQNIVVSNLTDLTSGNVDLDGYNASFPLGLTLDNVNFLAGASLSPAPTYANITLGPGPVTPASLTTSTGTGVTYSGGVTNPTEAPYACTAASFPTLSGDLFVSTQANTSNATPGQTNQQTLSVAYGGSFTLNAVVENLDALFTAPSALVNFQEGGTTIATGTLGGNGTLAQSPSLFAISGQHIYTAQYAGDATHPAFTFGSVTVTVAAAPGAIATTTTLSAPASANFGASVTLSAMVTAASGTTVPAGTVNFMNGSALLGSGMLMNGTARFTTSTLAIGTYSVSAVYVVSTAFQTSMSAASQLVINQDPQTITLSTLPASVTYGASALTVTASASSGLPVSLAVTGPATLNGSTLTITGAGSVMVTATQAGNATYAAATPAMATIAVMPAALVVTPANVTIPYYATIPALTGTVTGVVNGDAISASYSTTASSTSAAGTYPIAASLVDPNSRAGNYTMTLNTGTLTISQATTTSALSAPAAANFGASVTLSAIVTPSSGPAASGTVNFMNGSGGGATLLGSGTLTNGSASFTSTTLAIGSYSVTAVYVGSSNDQGSSSTATALTINKDPQTITLSTLPASLTYGASALTLTATANSGLAVTLAVSGPATLSGSTLTITGAGTVTITATQAGNTTYAAATTVTASVSVAQAPLMVTPMNVTVPYHGAIPALTGTLTGLVNGDAITASYATTATATSAPGPYPITATLSDPNNRAGNYAVTLNAGTLTVNSPATTTTLSVPASANYGASVILSATVTGASGSGMPTGTVSFMNGQALLGPAVPLTNGMASYTTSSLPVGSYSVTAVYAGTATFTGSSSAASPLVINQDPQTITISTLPASVTYGAAPLTVTATASSGLAVTLAVTGPATLTGSSLAITGAGTIKITATQAGNTNYAAATTASASVTVNPAPLVVTPANATIAYHGAIPVLTGTLATLLNGDNITAVFTTTATATSAPGTYPITATLSDPNGQAGNYTVTLNTGTLTITQVTTMVALSAVSATSYAGETLQLVAAVTSPTGVATNGTVNLMSGSMLVQTATVTSGLATFNLPAIAAGTYVYTAAYVATSGYGASTSTALNVTIVPPLTISLSPSSVSLAAGSTGSSTLTITPAGGYAGAAQVTCSSPVAYVTCQTTSAVAIGGTAPATDSITITVAGSARLTPPVFGWDRQQIFMAGFAGLGALLVLPLMKGRRRLARLMALAFLALGASFAVTGCGGPAANNPVINLPPAGNQAVTVTVLASGQTVTTTLTVNVTN